MTARPGRILVLALTMIVTVGTFSACTSRPQSEEDGKRRATTAEPRSLPAFDEAAAWLNAGSLSKDSLAGRLVVLAVWSDTDPRSLRALPEVEAWHRAYARFGVLVIGVHVPEFAFSADTAIPARVARRLGLTLPIALDPGYRIANQLRTPVETPCYVLADPGGRIVLEGEAGSEREMDAAIREALNRIHPDLALPSGHEASNQRAEAAPRVSYLGVTRVAEGPLATAKPGHAEMFTAQFRFQEEGMPFVPYPVGKWVPHADGLTAARGGAANFIAIRHEGGMVSAVLGPGPMNPSRVWIMWGNGWLPRAASGPDVQFDERGASYVEVTEPRVYGISSAAKPGVLRFSPEMEGVTVYSFVFEELRSLDR